MSAFRCTMCAANYPREPERQDVELLQFPEEDDDPCPMCWEPVDAIRDIPEHAREDLRGRITARRFEEFIINETDEERARRQAAYRPTLEATIARFDHLEAE